MSSLKNPTELSGMFGEEVTVRKVQRRLAVKNRPKRKMKRNPSDLQEAAQEEFLKAATYAARQFENPVSREKYARKITDKKSTAYLVALSDYLQPPKVTEIKAGDYTGAVGNVISIEAIDDFKVTRVRVAIRSSDGTGLEQGEAIQDVENPNIWRYTATVANPSVTGSKISATAFDLPENETSLEVVL